MKFEVKLFAQWFFEVVNIKLYSVEFNAMLDLMWHNLILSNFLQKKQKKIKLE